MQYGEDGPPPFLLFGRDDDEDDDGEDYMNNGDGVLTSPEAAGDDNAASGQIQIHVEMIEESSLWAVTHRIGQPLPHVSGNSSTSHGVCVDDDAAETARQMQQSTALAIAELQYRSELIQRHMGSLALCRGNRGDALYEAGAVGAALDVLAGLNRDADYKCSASVDNDAAVRLPIIARTIEGDGETDQTDNTAVYQSTWSKLDQATVALASTCLGAVRDLACGNASNRAAISEYLYTTKCCSDNCNTCSNQSQSGSQVLASYVRRYHEVKWEDIISLLDVGSSSLRGRKELRLFTDATGAIRNASHSTPKTCAGLHAASVTEMFIWRLKHGSKDECEDGSGDRDISSRKLRLPDARRPWREASFRIAGSLINISEKCPDSARRCGSDLDLVHLLVEAWGGAGRNSSTKQTPASTPLLHLGLAAILHAADDHLISIGQEGLDPGLRAILDKEEARKRFAQKKEAGRQERIARGLK